MEILTKLGIDPGVMIAQAINFFLIMGVLTYFVYRPVMRVLDERRDRIATADKRADEIERKLHKAEEDYKSEIAKARAEAKEIVEAAKKSAQTVEVQLTTEAQTKVEKMLTDASERIEKETAHAKNEIQKEVSKIALLAAEKLLGREIKAKDQETFVKDAMKELDSLK